MRSRISSSPFIFLLMTKVPFLSFSWRVPSKHLDPGKYSTRALLASPWPALQLLPRGQQVRTLVSRSQRAEANSTLVGTLAAAEQPWPTQKTLATLELRLLRWAVRAHDAYLDAVECTDDDGSGDGGDGGDEEGNGSMAVIGSDTATVKELVGLLQDMISMLPSSPSATSEAVHELLSLPGKKGRRVEQGRNSSPAEESARVQLALAHHLWLHYRLVVDSLARPAATAAGLGADAEPEPEQEPDSSQGPKVNMGFADARLARIEQATSALLSLQEQQQQRPLQPPKMAATTSPQTWHRWRETIREQQNILLAGVILGLLLSRLFS